MKLLKITAVLASLILVSALISRAVYADLFGGGKSSTQKVSKAMSPAKSDTLAILSKGAPRKVNFNFGRMKAWLNSDGDWNIQGRVKHTGLLCATYEVGMRFGAGDPGCARVEWLSEVMYVTSQRQCNSAVSQHVGGDYGSFIKADFDRVTCAERIIRCNGGCR